MNPIVYGKQGVETSIYLNDKICQRLINEDIDGTWEWIQLKAVLQNIRGKDMVTLLAIIDKRKEVIVKVQYLKYAQNEYDIQQKLKGLKGFIQYECFFTCFGDKEYINEYNKHSPGSKLCKGKGKTLGFIVMAYYKLSSFDKYLRYNSDKTVVIPITMRTIVYYIMLIIKSDLHMVICIQRI